MSFLQFNVRIASYLFSSSLLGSGDNFSFTYHRLVSCRHFLSGEVPVEVSRREPITVILWRVDPPEQASAHMNAPSKELVPTSGTNATHAALPIAFIKLRRTT